MREFSWHQALRSKLPDLAAPYVSTHLTDEERAAFQLALRDGYGAVEDDGALPTPLPDSIDTGILQHRFFVSHRTDGEEEADERSESFWRESDGERPPGPFELFPLHFDLTSVRIYFENQRARFVQSQKRAEAAEMDELNAPPPDLDSNYDFNLPEWFFGGDEAERATFDDSIWELAKFRLYTKPWYEYHALHLLALVEASREDVLHQTSAGGVRVLREIAGSLAMMWVGQLGRLVEQYNWRFLFEEAAKAGLAARRGASAGGLARSRALQREHQAWASAAKAIWRRRPELTKAAVGELVRKQLHLGVTGKHICRFITH